MAVEWDQRELCSDGACTGVIGADGLCRVCGRVAPNWGDERRRGLQPEPEPAPASTHEPEPEPEPDVDPASPTADSSSYEWSRRRLCPDGSCIGVIGSTNRCTVCGKDAAA